MCIPCLQAPKSAFSKPSAGHSGFRGMTITGYEALEATLFELQSCVGNAEALNIALAATNQTLSADEVVAGMYFGT
jgi:hypothetical protein